MAPSPASELPDWALQLLLAVQQHEDEHADDQPCLAAALAAVPADITRYAAAIDAHTRPLKVRIAELKAQLRTDEPEPAPPASIPDDHPCAHCGHPKRAHITGPVWCRHCPTQTSSPDQPGWHQYTPVQEQP